MLELVKRHIHMNRWKNNAAVQITLDDDFIVPDTMDDVAQVIMSTGDIQVESVKNQGEKVTVKGKLAFQILYRKEEGGLQTLAGTIPFEEPINVPNLEDRDYPAVIWDLEDLSAGIINSRKLSVKAMVTLKVRVETLYDAEAAVDVTDGGSDAGGGVQVQKREADAAALAVRRKDTYRIKENISLPGSKPSIERILWNQLKLRGVSTKPLDGQIHVEGELTIFLIYEGEGENAPAQWLEETLPFSGEVELAESKEGMVPSIGVRLVHKELEAKPDYDGEMRELEVDAILELDMKLYEEQQMELLGDVYATDREISLTCGQVCFDRLLSKNTGKCKISEKIDLDGDGRILQICHNDGAIRIDDAEIGEDSLLLTGTLDVTLLYMTSDDSEPVKAVVEPVPFEYTAETPGIGADSIYQLNTGLEQMTAVMAGGDTVEIKAVLSLDILVLQPVCEPVIESVSEAPLDMAHLQELPGIVGYIVQPGDSLWNIAKKFHTTVDNVKAANGLTEERVRTGDRLILVKEVAAG